MKSVSLLPTLQLVTQQHGFVVAAAAFVGLLVSTHDVYVEKKKTKKKKKKKGFVITDRIQTRVAISAVRVRVRG